MDEFRPSLPLRTRLGSALWVLTLYVAGVAASIGVTALIVIIAVAALTGAKP